MTKMTWHVNGCATLSRECSMYWSSRLRSVHCTMSLMSTCCGFPTPKTLYKPYPHPWNTLTQGKGMGLHRVRVKVGAKTPAGYPCPSLRVAVNMKRENSLYWYKWKVDWGQREDGGSSYIWKDRTASPDLKDTLSMMLTAINQEW